MKPFRLILALVLLPLTAHAVWVDGGPTNQVVPDVANWSSGWGAAGVTGWDYVGSVNGCSAVYLGNGWVITANHVGAGSFTLADGTVCSYLADSVTRIGATDLLMFQLDTSLALPDLAFGVMPTTGGYSFEGGFHLVPRDTVVMIGYGGGDKAWGATGVDGINQVNPAGNTDIDDGTTYFYTQDGSVAAVGGDSGGAAFIYRDGQWYLAGIMGLAATDGTNNYIFMAQLNDYQADISGVLQLDFQTVPEPSTYFLLGAGCLIITLTACRRRKTKA